jgi:radical SAM-linked protein
MRNPGTQISHPLIVRFAKTGLMRFIGHLDWQALQQSMFLLSGLKILVSEGPTHRLKMKTSPPTPVGVESMTELTYLLLTEAVYPDEAARRLSAHCPEGLHVVATGNAGHLTRKNPFGTIEAAGYKLNPGDGVSGVEFEKVMETLERIKSGPVPEEKNKHRGTEAQRGIRRNKEISNKDDGVKQFWGRILEIEPDDESIHLLVMQKEGETFHAAKCAGYIQKSLNLVHYPLFTKLDYYRLKPSKRKLFRFVG